MLVNQSDHAGIRFRVLSDDQCERIVLAALEVLERVGSKIFEPEAIALFKKAGCTVTDGLTVRVPAALVRDALQTAPDRFSLYDRTGAPAIRVEPNRAHFGPGPTCTNFIDPETGERRLFVKNDAALTARVCDALPNIDYAMSLGSVSDFAPEQADVHEFEAMLGETTKPIMSWAFGRESLAQIHRMCMAVKGSAEAFAHEPFMIHYAEPSPPLKHSAEAMQKLLYCAEHRIPLVYTPCDIAGGTAPVTLAGLLVQNLAESLTGVVLSQLVRPGAPVVVGGVVSILDMHTTILSYGAPELSLLSAAATEVAGHLGLPMFSTAGCTDSKCLDEQGAIEGATSILVATMSGANFVHDVGYSESAMTGSLGQLVMCDEIIGMARHIARGIRVDDDTLAVPEIAAAASGEPFITMPHTAEHFREELWFPGLLDRRRHGEWAADGAKPLNERVRDRLHTILAEHRAPALDKTVKSELSDIVAAV